MTEHIFYKLREYISIDVCMCLFCTNCCQIVDCVNVGVVWKMVLPGSK